MEIDGPQTQKGIYSLAQLYEEYATVSEAEARTIIESRVTQACERVEKRILEYQDRKKNGQPTLQSYPEPETWNLSSNL